MTTLPSILQIYNGLIANINAEFGANISTAKKVALRAKALALAGELWLFYKSVAKLQKNVFPDKADPIAKGGTLERFGMVRLGRFPRSAVAGEYTVQVTGTIGATIPAQTTFKSDDTSQNPTFLFIIDAAYTLVATTDTITLRALTPGAESKLAIGDTLTSTMPLVQVDRLAEVTAITVQPLSAESIEDYRTAVVNSYRLEAEGGAVGDYRIWSSDAQGVKKVYPYTGPSNSVNLYVEANIADSTDGKGTPPGIMITDVENVVELNPDTSIPLDERGRRPTGTEVNVLAITPKDIDIDIVGFAGVTAAQQALIQNALSSAIGAIRPFIAGAEPVSIKNDIIDTNKVNAFIIAAVPGAGYASVDLKVAGVSVLTYTFLQGEIPYFNSVNYI